jgi:hypothetical protein
MAKHPIYLSIFCITMFFSISILFAIVALPSINIVSTQSIESLSEVKGAVYAASADANEIPISAYFIASQSLAPSPIMPTLIPYY